MSEYWSMIPSFQRWNEAVSEAQRGDWKGYLNYVLRVEHILGSIEVFWPDFVELEGYILRKNNIPADWQKFLGKATDSKWSLQEVEYAVNHIHISDIFLNDPDLENISMECLRYIATTIAAMWRSRLDQLFPSFLFHVEVLNFESDPEVSAYTIRNNRT